jgi:hypothetical protein
MLLLQRPIAPSVPAALIGRLLPAVDTSSIAARRYEQLRPVTIQRPGGSQ